MNKQNIEIVAASGVTATNAEAPAVGSQALAVVLLIAGFTVIHFANCIINSRKPS